MTSARARLQKIGFIVYPGFSVMSLAASTAFEMANVILGKTVYEIHILSEDGGDGGRIVGGDHADPSPV